LAGKIVKITPSDAQIKGEIPLKTAPSRWRVASPHPHGKGEPGLPKFARAQKGQDKKVLYIGEKKRKKSNKFRGERGLRQQQQKRDWK